MQFDLMYVYSVVSPTVHKGGSSQVGLLKTVALQCSVYLITSPVMFSGVYFLISVLRMIVNVKTTELKQKEYMFWKMHAYVPVVITSEKEFLPYFHAREHGELHPCSDLKLQKSMTLSFLY